MKLPRKRLVISLVILLVFVLVLGEAFFSKKFWLKGELSMKCAAGKLY